MCVCVRACVKLLLLLFKPRSTEWSSVKSGAVKAADEGRGEFWIFLEDFLTYFSHVTICGALPEQLDDGSEQLRKSGHGFEPWEGNLDQCP